MMQIINLCYYNHISLRSQNYIITFHSLSRKISSILIKFYNKALKPTQDTLIHKTAYTLPRSSNICVTKLSISRVTFHMLNQHLLNLPCSVAKKKRTVSDWEGSEWEIIKLCTSPGNNLVPGNWVLKYTTLLNGRRVTSDDNEFFTKEGGEV